MTIMIGWVVLGSRSGLIGVEVLVGAGALTSSSSSTEGPVGAGGKEVFGESSMMHLEKRGEAWESRRSMNFTWYDWTTFPDA